MLVLKEEKKESEKHDIVKAANFTSSSFRICSSVGGIGSLGTGTGIGAGVRAGAGVGVGASTGADTAMAGIAVGFNRGVGDLGISSNEDVLSGDDEPGFAGSDG